jgi:signal transduction histidine kinase
MKRLYLQFYLTIVASLILVVVTAGMLWRFTADMSPVSQAFEMAGEVAAAVVAPADAPPQAQQQAIERLAERLHTDLALFSATGERLAATGRPLPNPSRYGDSGGWLRGPAGAAWSVRLPDGRWLVARVPPRYRHPGLALVGFLGAIALAVALAALPIARRITRRLERLQSGVELLGSGDLSARVKVEGRDEVARLAESFNQAAARIEELVGAHKMLLANASHELRTPLARIRLGIELSKEQLDTQRQAELTQDIAELDALIDEILLASRLDAIAELESKEEIDLLALAAEECARYEACSLDGTPVIVRGDPRLLRRMIRNLLENARRHGKPPIQVDVRHLDDRAVLRVRDQGTPIAPADRERLFAPFFRMPGATSGTGLGLALVRQIARRHGGDATYDPHCFTVTLPAGRPAGLT